MLEVFDLFIRVNEMFEKADLELTEFQAIMCMLFEEEGLREGKTVFEVSNDCFEAIRDVNAQCGAYAK